MTDLISILIVDDEEKTRRILELNLGKRFEVHLAGSGGEALALLQSTAIDIVLTDLKMPDVDGQGVLRDIQSRERAIPVIVMTAYGTIENAVSLIRQGAFDYVVKPIDLDQLDVTLARAVQHIRLIRENETLRAKVMSMEGVPNILTASPSMQKVVKLLQEIAPTDFTVLIQGETGTGKELAARAIHGLSPRATKPFIAVNCGAIPHDLLESEFFGSERGSFTGSVTRRIGKLEQAHQGTIFLDEVGDLPLDLQVKLLRALEEQVVTRLGGNERIALNFRIIAATNRELHDEVTEGRFRADLYYRLHVAGVSLPPLRERIDDLPLLAQHFLFKHQERAGKRFKGIDQRAFAYMNAYHWPGNIRELENVVVRAIVSATSEVITLDDLPQDLQLRPSTKGGALATTFEEFRKMKNEFKDEYLRTLERTFLLEHLRRNKWNISHTARAVGMDRRLLQNMMKDHGLKPIEEAVHS